MPATYTAILNWVPPRTFDPTRLKGPDATKRSEEPKLCIAFVQDSMAT